jgi:hypothetical protein
MRLRILIFVFIQMFYLEGFAQTCFDYSSNWGDLIVQQKSCDLIDAMTTAKIIQEPLLKWMPEQLQKDVAGAGIYKKIKALFDSSSTPYPMEDITAKSESDLLPFEGCVEADVQGHVASIPSIYVFRWKMTTKSGLGPLDPAEYKYGIMDQPYKYVAQPPKPAKFDGAYWNLDTYYAADSEPVPYCKDGTTFRDEWLNLQSEVSTNRQAFSITGHCNDGSNPWVNDYRKSGNYFVKRRSFGQEPIYVYCWKANDR